MIFTDLSAAVEEARWLRTKSSHHHRCVIQKPNGEMVIREERKIKTNCVMYTTRHDRYHTVLPGIK
ncbi:hypothetical protein [Xenorhabdus bovienii]|uniref:hypothetical protein n=1 Tax=Xenorhabdus bovienii TaxID=40576 RepID=UPI0023B21A50|nr:hypothetical protein [Xenorhabdus bovienii]MDE9467520.1 hypothetical protein [Xenorhabdus bovienii]